VLHVHRAERADGLLQGLAQLLEAPLTDPFAPEVVAVPTRGMERWLTQRLSARLGARDGETDGVCANVQFPNPGALLREAVASAAGVDPEADSWLPARALWPLLEVVQERLAEPWLARLAAHLGSAGKSGEPSRQGRRLTAVRHLVELFDRYALHRPAMVRAWATGESGVGEGGELPAEAIWQARLWRALRARIGTASPAERMAGACERLRRDPAVLALPERLAVFGLTRLAAGELEVLSALAAGRQVHLFLLHPSPALWEALAARTPAERGPRVAGECTERVLRRAEDRTAEAAKHPLLRSWGADAREMQLVLSGAGAHRGHHHPLDLGSATLLGRIQADICANRPPPGPPAPGQADARAALDPRDDSLQIHACHGRARQVEVLRDAILHLLAADPTLEPRDVIVMCPDIEAFAPLINAAFAQPTVSAEHDPAAAQPRTVDLHVRLADRSPRQTNPILALAAELIELPGRRLTASEVVALAEREPVRRRFGLDEDDLARVRGWARETGIRWGLDAEHRAPFKLDGLAYGTWRAGLDRLLVGVAMAEEDGRLWQEVLPVQELESGAIDLVGRLAELVARLTAAVDALSSAQPIAEWVRALLAAVDSLAAVGEEESWQRAELARTLDELLGEAARDGQASAIPLAREEVRALLSERLAARPTRANFRTGELTICTMYPMRSVPHRVVCLLGLDDGAFPRRALRDGEDLTLRDPRVGERDPRSEDRQLLLDALLAATERLIVAYTGNDERTNLPRPPAVVLGELLDTVEATVRLADGRARERIVVRHPLQPFDPRNFEPGRLVAGGAWGFDRASLDGARAMLAPRRAPSPFLPAPLAPAGGETIELEDLIAFVRHPVRAFLRARLRLDVRDFDDSLADSLSVELAALERWAVGERLLQARLRGIDGRRALLAEIRRGTLPPGRSARPLLREIHAQVSTILRVLEHHAPGASPADPLDVSAALPDGRTLAGALAGARGEVLTHATCSEIAPKHRLAAWVALLAASASHPGTPFRAVTVGKGGKALTLGPLGDSEKERRRETLTQLQALVDLHDRGMREPLPLYCRTSAAYAHAAALGKDPLGAARKAWSTEYRQRGEDQEPEHRLVLGGVRAFDELLAEEPREDERGAGWPEAEGTRLGRLARRLWEGPLRFEGGWR
jgi:exodeoxyribonuclease V gamma subunit